MTRATILLGTAVIALMFVIPLFAPIATTGFAVSTRFLERPGGIPGEADIKELNSNHLRQWVTDDKTAGFAKAYAWRVMPLDFVFLVVFGSFLAVGAHMLVSLGVPTPLSRLPSWAWLILPLGYVVTDLLEDILIIVLMTAPAAINDATVTTLAALRNLKFVSSTLAIAQIFLLGIIGTIR
jgi:hypothetical protein